MITYCVLNDLPSLLWAANTGAVELHPFPACARAALAAREALLREGLAPLAETSGGEGLYLYAPLAGTGLETFTATKALARSLARDLAGRAPDLFTDRQRR